ncbi:MAG: molecular chaperone HtpG [Kiritimatiellae bacterium]|nr:molecular chaperone HtpG [Kiritimatiellia bacterium]
MKKEFQTEVGQLLDLVINSLYSKKEVFLRELLSNSSDAIDRARFEALTDKSKASDSPYRIQIVPNKAAGTLAISDNGIGMTAGEIEKNLGTVASSGTKRFVQAMKEKAGAPELIGQFGVGFYAAFMVADRVDVLSRRRGAAPVFWTSDGKGSYDVSEGDPEAADGTTVTLHVRDDAKEYLDGWRIEDLVRTYSDYLAYPVMLCPDPSEKPEPRKDADGKELPPEPREPRQVNSMKAVWKKSKDEARKEETDAFYKHLAHDSEEPLATVRVSAEGATEFQALVFVPRVAPYDLYWPNAKQGLQLYVRNVFIGDDVKELLPRYLSFVRGVVESADLPLNVSREMLQDDAVVRRIRKVLVGKILGEIEAMQKDRPADFAVFCSQYGRLMKEGAHSDWENSSRLRDLCTFPSTFSPDPAKPVTLKEYVSRMPEGQKEIYYVAADTVDAAKNSPVLEAFASRGYEVLFFVDPVDEFFAERVTDYNGKPLRAADRGELDFDAADGKKKDGKDGGAKAGSEDDKRFAPLVKALKARYGKAVKDVRLSRRLVDSACCFVADEYGVSAHMQRVLKAFNQPVPDSPRILELNPKAPVIEKALALAGDDSAKDAFGDLADILLGEAQLAEGTPLSDPVRFNKLVSALAAK